MGELMRFIKLLSGVVVVIFTGSDCHHALISVPNVRDDAGLGREDLRRLVHT